MNSFSDQVVLVTGGSRGIGFETAKCFLECGAKVAICAADPQRLRRAENDLKQSGEVLALQSDVRDFGRIKAFVDAAQLQFGRIDVVVANAGVAWTGEFAEEDLAKTSEMVDVNVKGVLFTVRAALPHLLSRKHGVVINVSSGAGKAGIAGLATYCATKFAVIGFTEALNQEVSSSGVRVYAICPGRVATDMQEQVSGKKQGMAPQHIARQILKLAGLNPPVRSGKCLEVYS